MLTRTQALEGGANVTCISKVQFTYRSFIRLTIFGHYTFGIEATTLQHLSARSRICQCHWYNKGNTEGDSEGSPVSSLCWAQPPQKLCRHQWEIIWHPVYRHPAWHNLTFISGMDDSRRTTSLLCALHYLLVVFEPVIIVTCSNSMHTDCLKTVVGVIIG